MIRAIFFDVDGTLLSLKTHTVPPSTLEALDLLKEKAIKLFVATGRGPAQIKALQEILPFQFDGYVALNGQYCFNEEQLIHQQALDREDLKGLIPYLEEAQLACCYVEEQGMYLNCINDKVDTFFNKLGKTLPGFVIDKPERSLENKTYQLSVFITEEEADLLKHMPHSKTARWHPISTDIIPKDGGKNTGIQKVLDHYGIDKSEAMAFGDGANDSDMLQYVGIGIAMGNAMEKVKEVADYVTDEVDEDGILKALKHFKIL